jgi:mono/diheme cytochrome c family protein
VSEAREVYDVAGGCGACHGADGGGGVGPGFQAGAVVETWPEYTDHIEWVAVGSAGWPEDTYGAQNKPVNRSSGMPAFEERLSEEQLALVVRYEREVLGGAECEPELAELTGEPCE